MSSTASTKSKVTAKPAAKPAGTTASPAFKANKASTVKKPSSQSQTSFKPRLSAGVTAAKADSKPTKPAPKAPVQSVVKVGGTSIHSKSEMTEEEMQKSEEEMQEAVAFAQKAGLEAENARRNGSVLVRYNHYTENFTITNGTLSILEIDGRLCLSFAFPKCRLHMTDTEQSGVPNVDEDAEAKIFKNLEAGRTYWMIVEEDAEEAKLSEERNRAFLQRKAEQRDGDKAGYGEAKKKGVELLTQELKSLSVEELREAGPRYKELLAARDLEDCLFS